MCCNDKIVYPYIPNSSPKTQREMLDFIGVESIEDLLVDIPQELRINGDMDLPDPCLSEAELYRHMIPILEKNTSVREAISFLGAGCYDHQVPAIVDEIISSGEFLT
ncbi:MAG: aminomethyl-transferring glycine dehydrogenase, partial [Synergistales bacterium]|nr:aminomethyl-transferring glycine dehydrogenase [Synergistales bacterium]